MVRCLYANDRVRESQLLSRDQIKWQGTRSVVRLRGVLTPLGVDAIVKWL